MKKQILFTLIISLIILTKVNAQKRILFVTSNQHFYGNTTINASNHFGEIVIPHDVFTNAGFEIDFVSPKGGAIPIGYINTSNDIQKKYLYDGFFMNKLAHTIKPSEVNADNYSAILYTGGGAAMYGVAEDTLIQKIARQIYKRNGVISTICHGTAGIAFLKDDNGKSLYAGKRITGFPDILEDKTKEYYKTFPFAMDKAIKDNAGNFVYSKENNFYVVDGRFVTGQDPTSSVSVANEVIKLLNSQTVNSNTLIEKSNLDQIRETLLHYIEGTANGQPERLRKAFHPKFNLYTVTKDTLWTRSGEQYINNFHEGEKTNRMGRIISIDFEKDAATAKVEIIASDTRLFTDYFLLLKYQDSWKIVHKSYTWRELPKTNQSELNPEFFDQFMGDYVTPENELIVIGRSKIKLYAFNEQTNDFRGLNKVSDNTWTAGSSIKSNEVKQTYKFKSNKIEIYENEKLIKTAVKKSFYTNKKVKYHNSKGVRLGGTLFIPEKPTGIAVVLVHGAGPEDRNGYLSNLRLLADNIAREGVTVLTYDKQGVGESQGVSYEKLNFADLAQDALAGIDFLKSRKDLSIAKIGLVGVWQAGWIIPKAIEHSSNKIDFAMTITAPGTSMKIKEMDPYGTEIEMRCKGTYSETQISNVVTQLKYFYEFLENPALAKKLDDYTKSIDKDASLKEWLRPTSDKVDLVNKKDWFTVQEVNYDAIPVWKNFNKPVYMSFNEWEDLPSSLIKSRIDDLKKKNIHTTLIKNSQHGGFETSSGCSGDYSTLTKYNKDYFSQIKAWLKTIRMSNL
ncbi:nuclear transport factor 2 family protein [Flavobacterium sp. H122]|uniref:nuclear transport factor 2 family protein n=1 Tax=Flavobacterium sp. H122 TaxID=2529860 RepID=UPI0010AAE891|nr:nuclear transport factor 2 family protein [Flavobacterium sp. H122]